MSFYTPRGTGPGSPGVRPGAASVGTVQPGPVDLGRPEGAATSDPHQRWDRAVPGRFSAVASSLFSCLLNGNVRSVSTDNLKVVLREPYGIISSATANVQDLAAQNRFLGHNFDKVEIWPADVPRSVP